VRERQNFWETLDEIEPGALARLAGLVRDRKWEIIFLTSRPETKGTARSCNRTAGSRRTAFRRHRCSSCTHRAGKIAAALQLDVIIDDRPENCLDVAIDSAARAILVWRSDEDKCRPAPAARHRRREFDR
jgi:hypothetical protein